MRYSPDRPLGVAPASASDYRELARRRLPRQLFDYIDGGAYEEATMRSNVSDLEDVLLRQVVMRDVSERAKDVEVLGQQLKMPVILAPVGLAGMMATRAEVQAARAAEKAGIPFTESTVSICSIEEVAKATSRPPWFQLYVMRDRGYAEDLMARARAVGSPVLLLTIDLAVVGARHRDTRNAMGGDVSAWAKARRVFDLVSHSAWIRDVPIGGGAPTFGNLEKAVPDAQTPDAFREWVDEQFDPSVTWDDIAWVRENWPGRLVVKGVLDPEDARRAADAGVDGIVVSNHGGRQLDAVPSPARAPPDIAPGGRGQGGDRAGPARHRRGGRRPGRGARGRRRTQRTRRGEDGRDGCTCGPDRASLGVGRRGARRARRPARAQGDEGGHRHGARAHRPDRDRRRRPLGALRGRLD